ncbi:2-nitropropane dioxygenase, putative [Alloalcanivorax dieselolei B5]|uniref:2-nitropropane dioxygenase, putative n=1 Tax=Alcanivorax dieselolei (strain DSM 16502 / CGMCC 1.3690 / MCCC 1A00001 / B-5) TaxID=930169 RepID=K0CFA3_ALCDB|nr:nitronate monooxygenase [Alloalcanivorax dieselolei]AFT71313.1 2-nitropropane dioxygenase, putative [Alloalcanivorax dieselolei B5]GGJ94760.1 2-nitropropane dioxygenase [Alloalcanivorax dieselolei]
MAVVTPPPALRTPLCDHLGCTFPILLAGMGGVARHRLAAAVCRAGGFGVLGMVREPVERIRNEIQALRQLTDKPFAVNLIPAATERALLRQQVQICVTLQVPFVVLFWDVDSALIRHLTGEGVRVIHQVGSPWDAELAIDAGAEVIIAQGWEAGGHVRGQVGTLSLLAELIPSCPVPVVASGGIANGRSLVAALALGAQGASLGSAFLATEEANAHVHHQQRLIQAGADDTVHCHHFSRNWHEPAPVRVLRNRVTRGEYEDLRHSDISEIIGEQDGQPVYLFSTDSPLADARGELDDMALYAGQSCGQIHQMLTAEQRLNRIIEEAMETLARLGGAATATAH